jgi:hypothetical protein
MNASSVSGSSPAPMVLGYVSRLKSGLEQLQTQFGVFGDAPFRPAAHLIQRGYWSPRHGAVLDDGIVLVALDHADMEKPRYS